MQHLVLIGSNDDYFKTCPRRLLKPPRKKTVVFSADLHYHAFRSYGQASRAVTISRWMLVLRRQQIEFLDGNRLVSRLHKTIGPLQGFEKSEQSTSQYASQIRLISSDLSEFIDIVALCYISSRAAADPSESQRGSPLR